ncbi:MAG TPA: hypothetical protein PLJ35_03600 [Anaerolineae bacterium]|nr:hypothetical protein [Anaerolineae bacterium]HOQ97887.1 hypothetical protein [Anaerolineae bacterium]HPL26705.1 hypothetical protein [Anaerolineae bacterium]
MEKDRPLTRSQLFTVRLWLEDLGDGRQELRGKVQHALSGEARYFRDWPALLAFFSNRVAPSSDDDAFKAGRLPDAPDESGAPG